MNPLDARLRAEQEMHRAIAEAGYRRQMVEAAAIDPAGLSEQGQRILAWLHIWDDWTTGGVVELLTAARAAGGLPEAEVRQRQEAAVREESAAMDAAVRRYRERLERLGQERPDPRSGGLGGPR